MSNNTNPTHDRPYGEMGVGRDTEAMADWEKGADRAKAPKENAEGWESKSFTLPLGSGQSLGDYDPSDSNESLDGPAWPSNSAKN
jgi:hypothetical protein